MYNTTFPMPDGMPEQQGQPQGQSQGHHGGQNQYGQSNQSGNDGGYQKKPWQNNNYQGNQGGQGQQRQWGNQGQGGGGGGGWSQNRGGGGGGGWQRPKETDLSFYKPVAMTGNPDAPPEIIERMIQIAKRLEAMEFTVRIGGMQGIEDAIEKAIEKKEVHLPFKDFDQKQSKFTYVSERATAVAKMFFPNWDAMKKGVQLFLAKNARVLMGQRVDSPALFFVCWTQDGVESFKDTTNRTGFTGHSIAIASALGIPIFNLGNPTAEQRLNMYLETTHVSKKE